MEKIYIVASNSDLTEGRGKRIYIAYCKSMSTAKRISKKKGVMGTDADVIEVELINIGGNAFISANFLNIEHPTREDETEQKRLDQLDIIIRKAKDSGLSDDEIKILRRG